MKALLLLSGGHDSTLLLHRHADDIGACVFFSYGQKQHEQERGRFIEAVTKFNKPWHMEDLGTLQKADDSVYEFRNGLFVLHAAVLARKIDCDAVMIGCNMNDWLRFPDCRPEFWKGMRDAFEAGEYPVKIMTPLLTTEKHEILQECQERGIDAWTCYSPTFRGEPCGECYACESVRKYA